MTPATCSAERGSTLDIPPDLTQPTKDEKYTVPDITPKGSATFSAYAGDMTIWISGGTAQEWGVSTGFLPNGARLMYGPNFPATTCTSSCLTVSDHDARET